MSCSCHVSRRAFNEARLEAYRWRMCAAQFTTRFIGYLVTWLLLHTRLVLNELLWRQSSQIIAKS
jgi:hypothetical protein